MTDFELMGAALEEARKAAALGEVPVGAVVAKDGEIISAAHNTRETEKNALHHAELLAIDAACKKLGGWRLWQCELFVTLEPCPMCSGAIINSRIKRVVYGAADEQTRSSLQLPQTQSPPSRSETKRVSTKEAPHLLPIISKEHSSLHSSCYRKPIIHSCPEKAPEM